jgi:hypothetical protein
MWVATPSTCELRKLNHHETVYTEIRCCKQSPSTSPGVALPLLSMIGQAQWSIEKLLGQLSRQFIEQLPVLSLESVAGAKHPGRHAGAVRWHRTQRGVVALGLSQGPRPAVTAEQCGGRVGTLPLHHRHYRETELGGPPRDEPRHPLPRR